MVLLLLICVDFRIGAGRVLIENVFQYSLADKYLGILFFRKSPRQSVALAPIGTISFWSRRSYVDWNSLLLEVRIRFNVC